MLFSDEKKFCLDGPDGANYYWRDLRKEPLFFTRRNFGGGSIMCWLSFGAMGKVNLAFPSSKMDSREYQVLEAHLLPFFNKFHRLDITFQQDNASIHVNKTTREWLASKKVKTMNWPACSPDLNPVENVWAIIVRRLYAKRSTTGPFRSSRRPFWRFG